MQSERDREKRSLALLRKTETQRQRASRLERWVAAIRLLLRRTRLGIILRVQQRRRQSMYYCVAIQRQGDPLDGPPSWQWQSTTLSSLSTLFQFLRLYGALRLD